jgi:hypothetical protein
VGASGATSAIAVFFGGSENASKNKVAGRSHKLIAAVNIRTVPHWQCAAGTEAACSQLRARAIRGHTGAVFSTENSPVPLAMPSDQVGDAERRAASAGLAVARYGQPPSLRVVAPAFCASRMMGRTFAAYLSASAFIAYTAPLRATWSLGLPRNATGLCLQLWPGIHRVRALAGLHLNELAVDLEPLCLEIITRWLQASLARCQCHARCLSNVGGMVSSMKSLSVSASNGLRSILKFVGAALAASL